MVDRGLEVRVLGVDHQPHAERLRVRGDRVQTAEHPLERAALVGVERRMEERAARAAALHERADGLERHRVQKFDDVDVARRVGVDALEGRRALVVGDVERLAPAGDEGLAREHAGARRVERLEEGAELHQRRRRALEQLRVAEGGHLDRGEALGRRRVHGVHRLEEDGEVGVALLLRLVRVDARRLVDVGRGRRRRQVRLRGVVEDAADADAVQLLELRRNLGGVLARDKVREHGVAEERVRRRLAEQAARQREAVVGVAHEPRLGARGEHGGAAEKLEGRSQRRPAASR